jgi:pyridoxine/pyridoxamine 5'-phosphate oxidase
MAQDAIVTSGAQPNAVRGPGSGGQGSTPAGWASPLEAATEHAGPGTPGDAGEPGECGVWVYCVIETDRPLSFGKIGIGGRGDEVYTVHYKDLAAVVSRTALMVYDPTRENALAHNRVNQVIVEEYELTPVPMSFGTLFRTEDDVIEFLKDTYDALHDVLQKMKGKLEYGLKVNWNREEVIAELEQEHEEIRRLKSEIVNNQRSSTYFARMQLGRLVEQALAEKSSAYQREIYSALRESAIASRASKPIGDRMIMNAAFLVERDKAEAFDHKLQEIEQRYEGKLRFTRTGPWAPYNFVTIRLQLERSSVV